MDLSAGLCSEDTLCWFVITSACATQHFNLLPGQQSQTNKTWLPISTHSTLEAAYASEKLFISAGQ